MTHPTSMLSKIFGIYEIQIKNDPPFCFFITENMMNCDLSAVKRCFDLKGSIY